MIRLSPGGQILLASRNQHRITAWALSTEFGKTSKTRVVRHSAVCLSVNKQLLAEKNRSKCAGDPKPIVLVSIDRLVPVPIRATTIRCVIVEGTATQTTRRIAATRSKYDTNVLAGQFDLKRIKRTIAAFQLRSNQSKNFRAPPAAAMKKGRKGGRVIWPWRSETHSFGKH